MLGRSSQATVVRRQLPPPAPYRSLIRHTSPPERANLPPAPRLAEINPDWPIFGEPTTQSVRDNFAAIRNLYEAMQEHIDNIESSELVAPPGPLVSANGSVLGNLTLGPNLSLAGTFPFQELNARGGASVGATPPSNPVVGDLWQDTNDGRFKFYNGVTWVGASGTGEPPATGILHFRRTSTLGNSAWVGDGTYNLNVFDGGLQLGVNGSTYGMLALGTGNGGGPALISNLGTTYTNLPSPGMGLEGHSGGLTIASPVITLGDMTGLAQAGIINVVGSRGTHVLGPMFRLHHNITSLSSSTQWFEYGVDNNGFYAATMGGTSDVYTIRNVANSTITLVRDPLVDLEAATKRYVDAQSGSTTVGTTPPTNPNDGMFWWDGSKLWIWDGTQHVWVGAGGGVSTNISLTGDGLDTLLAINPATIPEIVAGTDNLKAITSAGLRNQLGLAAGHLLTDNKTVVPAINELFEIVEVLEAGEVTVGVYDAAADITEGFPGSGLGIGPLPPASPANRGWRVIVTVAGQGQGNAPNVPLAVGDTLLSVGTQWVHIPTGHIAVPASSVLVSIIPGLAAPNVQAALQEIHTNLQLVANAPVTVDNLSIVGTGRTIPLSVHIIDGGEI